jgi:hypothetical protein
VVEEGGEDHLMVPKATDCRVVLIQRFSPHSNNGIMYLKFDLRSGRKTNSANVTEIVV